MAGIGFELRRMIDQRQGFVAKARAYACAGLISSGPWLMTILTLSLLSLAAPLVGAKTGFSMFRALVTYSFAFSLILQGTGQMAITRWVADLLYAKKYDRVLPAFAATLAAAGVVCALIGTAFCAAAGFSPALAWLSVTLFAILGMTWIALTWLSVAREYDEVLRAYIYGTLVAVGGMALMVIRDDTVGILGAYTVGQAYTLVRLVRVIVRGMEAGGRRDLRVFRSLGTFPRLVALGLAYNTAIWIDKMVFWYSDGTGTHPWVRYHPLYDTCSFLAYLTVVPALAVNLIRLETSFYEYYRGYYGAILGGMPLRVIEDRRARMFENLQESTIRLLRVQGAISIGVIIFAPLVIDFLELPPIAVRIFRLTALGAFFHVMLLLTMLMQLYFDLRRQALATAVVFLALNGGLAFWSAGRGVETYGVGYAVASFLTLLLGYTLLHRSLERLDHLTFTSQKISDQPDAAATVTEAAIQVERPPEPEAPVAVEEPPAELPAPAPEPEPAAAVERAFPWIGPDEAPEEEVPETTSAGQERDETSTDVELPLADVAPDDTATDAGVVAERAPARDEDAGQVETKAAPEPEGVVARPRTDDTATEVGAPADIEEEPAPDAERVVIHPRADDTATDVGAPADIEEEPAPETERIVIRPRTDDTATEWRPVPLDPEPERIVIYPDERDTDTDDLSLEETAVDGEFDGPDDDSET